MDTHNPVPGTQKRKNTGVFEEHLEGGQCSGNGEANGLSWSPENLASSGLEPSSLGCRQRAGRRLTGLPRAGRYCPIFQMQQQLF